MANNPPIKPPTAESLALSASVWTNNISSWIPASFASSSRTTAPKLPDLSDILETAGDESDRLGLGHPSIGKPKTRAPGLKELEKRMLSKRKGKGPEDSHEPGLGGDGDEEEESRTNMKGKKRKHTALDLLGGKKSKGAKGSQQSSTVTSRAASPSDDGGSSTPLRQTATSSPGGSGIFPFEGPIAPDSPAAVRVLSERKQPPPHLQAAEPDDEDVSMSPSKSTSQDGPVDGGSEEGAAAGGGMSKSALRRARRKAQKATAQDAPS